MTYDFARERHEARVEAERLLLDSTDDGPSRAEVLEDARLDRFASRRPGPPFHEVVRARQDEGRRGA